MAEHLKIIEMKTQFCMIAAIVSTGMMAGIFFTWTNAVTPGIGRLDDMGYLTAFKSMNKTILNPLFFVLFFLPLCAIPLTAFLKYQEGNQPACILLAVAALLYVAGCICVTVSGNVPLNDLLEKTDLINSNVQQLTQLRSSIEVKWNLFNLIRTVASVMSFSLLVISVCVKR
ncbi:conserved hypothetical protein [Cytophaga hutchinsonii ATCC 33406]|uniref:Integral-membrane protein n=3 Tax=Cytophaga hutchinsonii TaxID=985 RepID=A0A6N4SPZ9_CYTH3|nr:conserved hypothetical protein [Cytophaga hutchinsonii ATCC 33406]